MMTREDQQPGRLRLALDKALNLPQARPKLVLILLTLIAGAIRFTRLSHPALWYDESMVFWRTCGTYGQLLDCLRTDGFVPLHYSLMWLIKRFVQPTPFALRFVPALCGTVMVPAVYFLALQLVHVRTALLAAAFTACSAFMLFYSRDAKMYMDAWLFMTLNSACLLWWFRSNCRTAWLCWIACGCIACGLHFSSAIPVGISVLLLLTQSKLRWQNVLLWTLGVLVILSGPVGYYEKFNVWKDRIDEEGWKASELAWINDYNYGRNGPQLVRCLGTSTIIGWEWPKDLDFKNIPPSRIAIPSLAFEILIGILVLACLPWPPRWHGKPVLGLSPSAGMPGKGWGESNLESQFAIEQPNHPHPDPLPAYRERVSEPQWRVVLWLTFWIVIPVYGFYCRSMPGFYSPMDWWHGAVDVFPALMLPMHHPLLWIAVALVPICAVVFAILFQPIRPLLLRAVGLIVVAVVVLGLCQAIAVAAHAGATAAERAGKPWESLWVPRYIGFIWPALAIAIASLLMRLPTWPLRTVAIVFLLGLNLGIASFRIFGDTEPPVDRMAADVVNSENPARHMLAWMNLKQGMQSPGGGNLFSGPGEYYIDVLSKKITTPRLFKQSISIREKQSQIVSTPWYLDLPADLEHVVIWNQLDVEPPYAAFDLTPRAGWELVSDQFFTARQYWIWQDLTKYRRREYQRESP